ncbi:MAG: diacylglycerol kinase [Burkholderiaceae bacterium]|jgi:diacylglycerol kinase (ATP)|nr:diacylglycerol kinase [Burkholderiaceae bacterium]
MSDSASLPPAAPPKRKGLVRLWHAARYSLAGLRLAWHEPAFRQEAIVAVIAVPLAYWLGRNWVEVALLLGALLLLLIVELLNTGIEACIDRIGPEFHPLSKRAKDLGSAAVFLALLLAAGIWLAALFSHFFLYD